MSCISVVVPLPPWVKDTWSNLLYRRKTWKYKIRKKNASFDNTISLRGFKHMIDLDLEDPTEDWEDCSVFPAYSLL